MYVRNRLDGSCADKVRLMGRPEPNIEATACMYDSKG